MKSISLFFVSLCCLSFINWHYNLSEAKTIAHKEHKHLLVNFSGSDWCGPCIRLHKEIFGSSEFQAYASKKLVLVNADFPRLKKNQLSAAQQKINDAIADQYNPKGIFPYTVLLNENGKVIKDWDGFPKESPDAFVAELSTAIDADK